MVHAKEIGCEGEAIGRSCGEQPGVASQRNLVEKREDAAKHTVM